MRAATRPATVLLSQYDFLLGILPQDTIVHTVQNAADLIGRILLAIFFIPSGISKVVGYTGILA